jgi:hypothetical protein
MLTRIADWAGTSTDVVARNRGVGPTLIVSACLPKVGFTGSVDVASLTIGAGTQRISRRQRQTLCEEGAQNHGTLRVSRDTESIAPLCGVTR